MIALACAAGSACSHRRRDTGRDTPYHLLDLCRPSDGRRARRDLAPARCAASAEITSFYDERPRLPVGLAIGAADQGPRACHSARGLTGRERDLRFRGPGTEGSNPASSSSAAGTNLRLPGRRRAAHKIHRSRTQMHPMKQMHRPNPFQLRSTTTVLPSNRIIIGRIRRRLLKVKGSVDRAAARRGLQCGGRALQRVPLRPEPAERRSL